MTALENSTGIPGSPRISGYAADLTLQGLARHSSFLLQRRGRGERDLQQVVGAGHFGADAHAGRGAA